MNWPSSSAVSDTGASSEICNFAGSMTGPLSVSRSWATIVR